jgi:type VI secretion system protein ImpL
MTKPSRTVALLRPLLTTLGWAALAALLWFCGPLLVIGNVQPLAEPPMRLLAIGVLALLALLHAAWLASRSARRNRLLMEGLVGDDAPGAHEVEVIGKRFADAVALLKRHRIGAGKRSRLAALGAQPYVYQLPWYVIIGAPGAGKTTALANSGLEFPLAAKLGKPVVRGIGGTRNCDWWFSTDAVLIDTAGRYTTQDSDRAADRAAWLGFLDLLVRYRPGRPINGVLLTLSVADLLQPDRDKRIAHARALRARIDELHERLGIAFPIYVLITKTDLLAGFMEFFADFDRDERAQVWGVTFAHDEKQQRPDPLVLVGSELATLEKRLDECLIDRLRGERDRERRAAIYAFPQQWRVLRETLLEFLHGAFASDASAAAKPLLRGVYFTSATQEGTPMDRALGALARSLGLAARIVAPARPSGKTFFMTRLLRDVVFREAGLAGTQRRWQRQRAWLQWGAIGATAAVVAVGLLFGWRSYVDQREQVASIAQRLQALRPQVAAAKATPDLPPLTPVLDTLAALGAPDARAAAPWPTGLAPDARAPLAAAADDAYRELLKQALLPRIATRLEQRLASSDEHAAAIYEALKAYLMLFGGKNFDRAALRSYLVADWETIPAAQRDGLRRHLDQLLAGNEVGAPSHADQRLVAQARAMVAKVPLAQRVYNRLKQADAGAAAFGIDAAGGAQARKVFVRASGQPLEPVVPRLYTRANAQGTFRARSEEVLRQFAGEASWVLGTASAGAAPAAGLLDEIEQRYVADYTSAWEQFVGDLRLVVPDTLAGTAETAGILARADSPLRALLGAVVNEVSVGNEAIDAPFDALRRFVTARPAPLDEALELLGKLATYLTAVDDAVKRKTTAPSSDVTRELAIVAARAPEPVRALLAPLAATSATQVFAGVREQLGRQLASELAPACTRSVEGRYPLARASRDEMSREEFVRAFGSGGVVDGFFQKHLAPFVDASARSWSFRGAGAGDSLPQFQRAQAIRDAFFVDGGRTLSVRLELRLLEMDPGMQQFSLDVDGQVLRFARDTKAAQRLQWPAPSGGAGRVVLQVAAAGAAAPGGGYAFEGPWALLRLFDRVRVEPGSSPDRVQLLFDIEGRKARFEAKSATRANPIRLPELEQFQCPKRL